MASPNPTQEANKCRIIYPNKRFANAEEEKKERKNMKALGMKFNINSCTLLSQTCFFGYFDKFLKELEKRFESDSKFNINAYFETESEWSLLHFCMFGKKRCNLVMKDKANTFKHLQIITWLLQNGCNVNTQSKWGYTVLYESIMNNPDITLSKLLLDHGADVNIKNVFGSTALFSAVLNKNIEIIKLLLKYNADPRIKHEFYNFTAADLAKSAPKILLELTKKRVKLQDMEENKTIFQPNSADADEKNASEFKDVMNETIMNSYSAKSDQLKSEWISYDISSKQYKMDQYESISNEFEDEYEFQAEDEEILMVKGRTNWEEKYMHKKPFDEVNQYNKMKQMLQNKQRSKPCADEKDAEHMELVLRFVSIDD